MWLCTEKHSFDIFPIMTLFNSTSFLLGLFHIIGELLSFSFDFRPKLNVNSVRIYAGLKSIIAEVRHSAFYCFEMVGNQHQDHFYMMVHLEKWKQKETELDELLQYTTPSAQPRKLTRISRNLCTSLLCDQSFKG